MARAKALIAHDPLRRWTAADANDTYNIPRWGCGYFGVNDQGNLIVAPRPAGEVAQPPLPNVVTLGGAPGAIDMKELIDELVARATPAAPGERAAQAQAVARHPRAAVVARRRSLGAVRRRFLEVRADRGRDGRRGRQAQGVGRGRRTQADPLSPRLADLRDQERQ